jgi:hypothetical protein
MINRLPRTPRPQRGSVPTSPPAPAPTAPPAPGIARGRLRNRWPQIILIFAPARAIVFPV